jgi:Flp pilus assembly protein TadD
LLLTFFAYLPALDGSRLWDDAAHITTPELQSVHGLYRIWFELGATQQYYPLLHTAFWLEHKLWGDSVLGYHLVNLLWHLIAVGLVYRILERLKIPGALLAAAIFAVHPVMVESVAWITEQKNTLSAVFYLSAMLVYLKFDESREHSAYLLALVLFILGVLTKTVTATLPAALLVIFWWQRGTLSLKRDVAPLVPFFALGAAAGVLTAWIERTQIGAEGAAFELTFLQRSLLAGRVVWFYLAKLLWPLNLSFIYPRWHIAPAIWWQWLFPIATLTTFILLCVIRKKWRGPLAAWLFFCGTLFPVLGFLNVFPFIFSFVADHFQYLASLGIIVLASAAIAVGLNRLPQTAKCVGEFGCMLLVALLAALTARQSSMYADSIAVYNATLTRNPDCWMAHNNLGADLYEKGDNSDAIEHYRAALRIRPDYFEAHKNLGIALMKQEAYDEASVHFAAARQLRPREFDVLTNLGNTLLKTGRASEAIAAFRAAVRVQPHSWSAYNNLGLALLGAHTYDEAITCFEHALQLNPEELLIYNDLADAQAHTNDQAKAVATLQHGLELANARGDKALIGNFRIRLKVIQNPNDPDVQKNFGFQLARAGHYSEAVAKLQAALALKPDDVTVLNILGIASMRLGRAPQGVEYFSRAVRLKPNDVNFHANLAKALAAAHRREDAIATAQEAIKLARNAGQVALAGEIEEWLKNYRAELPSNQTDAVK